MSTAIEKLPDLLDRAARALDKATSAGEILEAQEQANVAYTAAKTAARMKSIKGAHDTVLAACRNAMADALMIETRAQVRLADEYDAAQKRGEVKAKAGGDYTSIVPKRNEASTAADVGLTRKQVHEARKVRDAEKATPGVVREAVEEKLSAGKEPTRADVKRAVNGNHTKSSGRRGATKPTNKGVSDERRRQLAADVLDHGKTVKDVAGDAGVSEQIVKTSVATEKGRREAEPTITPDMLSMTAQEKLDAAIRQHQRKLDSEFHQRVNQRVAEFVDTTILPDWKQKIETAHRLYDKRKALMDKDTFNTIRRGLHPDSRNAISDRKLGEAFDAFMALEKYLLDEKDSPTPFGESLPQSFSQAAKQKAREARKAKRATSRRHLQ